MTARHAASTALRRRTAADWLRVGKGYTQTSESLALYRIAFALVTLVVLGPTRIGVGVTSGEVGGLPSALYHPPLGPAMLLTGWPPETAILGFEILLTIALSAVVVGAFTRTASLTVAVCGLVLTSLLYAEGKVDHAFLWAVLIPAIMAWSSWGDTWSIDASRVRVQQRRGFQSASSVQVSVIAVALGIMFAAAAAVKSLTGWLDPGTSSILGWAFAQGIQSGGAATPPPLLGTLPALVWPILDYVVVIFEAGFLLAVLRRHWLVPYLTVAAAFHLSAGFVGFPAFFDIAVVYLLFVRLDAASAVLRRPLNAFQTAAGSRPQIVVAVLAAAVAVYCAVAVVLDGPLTVARVMGFAGIPFSTLWVLVLVAVCAAFVMRSRPPEDRPGNDLPAWAFPAAAAFLAAQTALTLNVSEPYPLPVGPLFMGNFDDGQTINVARQQFSIVDEGRSVDVTQSDAFSMSTGGATQLGAVRFPAPPLDSSGDVIDNPTAQDRLGNQYHHFSSAHLPNYGGELSEEEARWIRANLRERGISCGTDCALEVKWERISFDRTTGNQVSERVVDNERHPLD